MPENQSPERSVRGEVIVPAGIETVWNAWTTEAGVRTFFAPEARVELRIDGPYELYFDLDEEPGKRGGEEMRILAFQPKKMLSFTWNAPPELAQVRGQRTHVMVRFAEVDADHTRVVLVHDGWGEGGEWDQAYDYFIRAWLQVVLPRLVERFKSGPRKW